MHESELARWAGRITAVFQQEVTSCGAKLAPGGGTSQLSYGCADPFFIGARHTNHLGGKKEKSWF